MAVDSEDLRVVRKPAVDACLDARRAGHLSVDLLGAESDALFAKRHGCMMSS